MSNLSLTQIVELIRNSGDNMENLVPYIDEILDFSKRVDDVATEILKSKDADYLMGMFSTVQALALMIMIGQGESPIQVMMMAKDDDLGKYAALIMKMTVGISVMEELR